MKRPTMLYQAMLRQLSIDLEVSTERDYEYIRSRFEHEGISFLTITLPSLSDSLESGLENGRLTLPPGFKPRNRNGTLPAFLQGLFRRVFELDGSLLPRPCPQSIYWIRQISRFFKKPKIACSPQRNAEAVRRYKAIEENLNDETTTVLREDLLLDSVAAILWSTTFPNVDDTRIVCRHGPGVTSDRRLSNERRRIRYWYQRAEDSFPVADHAFHNFGYAWKAGSSEGVSGIKFLSLTEEPPVRVVFVPKTLSTPRVIAIEPSSMQFIQQGLSRYMVDILERHRLTRNSIRFSDQFENRRLAYKASIDRKQATIDLSDASDRVHLELVRRLFKRSPLLQFLEDARSLHADLPDGSNVILRKYASMGSALCFPVEACVFYTLVLTAIIRASGKRPSYKTIERLSRSIAIFGDDIIVPTKYVDAVSDYLESYALRVNRRKSFSKSAFRESCGADFFQGESVLPVYARQMVPSRRSEWTPSHVMAWIATADQFYLTGKWHICQVIRDMVEQVVRSKIPRSRVYTRGLGFYSLLYDTRLRFDSDTCGYKQRRIVYAPSKRKDIIDGDDTACFNKVFENSRPQMFSRCSDDARFERPYLHVDDSLHGSAVEQVFDCRSVCHDIAGTDGGYQKVPGEDERRPELGFTPNILVDRVSQPWSFERPLLEIDPSRIDFHNTTKRGVFTLKRQWVTIFS